MLWFVSFLISIVFVACTVMQTCKYQLTWSLHLIYTFALWNVTEVATFQGKEPVKWELSILSKSAKLSRSFHQLFGLLMMNESNYPSLRFFFSLSAFYSWKQRQGRLGHRWRRHHVTPSYIHCHSGPLSWTHFRGQRVSRVAFTTATESWGGMQTASKTGVKGSDADNNAAITNIEGSTTDANVTFACVFDTSVEETSRKELCFDVCLLTSKYLGKV